MQHFFKKANTKETIAVVTWSLALTGLWGYSLQQILKKDTTNKNNIESNLENPAISYTKYE
jgi:hypothetical protein